jgi:outer membrane protein OmpA-like peptidoglycan-associated protein
MKKPEFASWRFAVNGHTDAVGDRDYNLDLSSRRAKAVVDYLVSQGVDPSRLVPNGYGFDQPRLGLAPNNPRNRRVELSRAS